MKADTDLEEGNGSYNRGLLSTIPSLSLTNGGETESSHRRSITTSPSSSSPSSPSSPSLTHPPSTINDPSSTSSTSSSSSSSSSVSSPPSYTSKQWIAQTKTRLKSHGWHHWIAGFSFCLAVGTYWELRSIKDAIFAAIVGFSYQPVAKILSVILIVPFILAYTKMMEHMSKPRIVFYVSLFYGSTFFLVAHYLGQGASLSRGEAHWSRVSGWLIFLIIESYGSMFIVIFWSLLASSSNTESAKRSYPLVIAASQLGAVLGPTLATYSKALGFQLLFSVAGFNIWIAAMGMIVFAKISDSTKHPSSSSSPSSSSTSSSSSASSTSSPTSTTFSLSNSDSSAQLGALIEDAQGGRSNSGSDDDQQDLESQIIPNIGAATSEASSSSSYAIDMVREKERERSRAHKIRFETSSASASSSSSSPPSSPRKHSSPSSSSTPTSSSSASSSAPSSQAGLLEGLRLLLTRPYVLGIFCITASTEIVNTLFDYQVKASGQLEYPNAEDFAIFMGRFGQLSNILALGVALGGTRTIIQVIGSAGLLLLYPAAAGTIISVSYLYSQSIWHVFTAAVFLRGLNQALNSPSRELLYIPTSHDIKFKAKSWIDMFGVRMAKALGSSVIGILQTQVHASLESFNLYCTLISLTFIAGWMFTAKKVSRLHNQLLEKGDIVT